MTLQQSSTEESMLLRTSTWAHTSGGWNPELWTSLSPKNKLYHPVNPKWHRSLQTTVTREKPNFNSTTPWSIPILSPRRMSSNRKLPSTLSTSCRCHHHCLAHLHRLLLPPRLASFCGHQCLGSWWRRTRMFLRRTKTMRRKLRTKRRRTVRMTSMQGSSATGWVTVDSKMTCGWEKGSFSSSFERSEIGWNRREVDIARRQCTLLARMCVWRKFC